MKGILVLVLILWPAPLLAQGLIVRPWADYASYATAPDNLVGALSAALQGDHKACDLARLGLSAGVETGGTLWWKSQSHADRPCTGSPGCNTDSGEPSGHTALGFIGMRTAWGPQLSGWQRISIAIGTAVLTGILRHTANQHFWSQIGWGALLGGGSEAAGLILRCEGS